MMYTWALQTYLIHCPLVRKIKTNENPIEEYSGARPIIPYSLSLCLIFESRYLGSDGELWKGN